MKRRSKEGFVLSALLHGGVVGLAIFLPMLDLSDREKENEFVLVPVPPLSGPVGGGSESAPATTKEFDFNGPDTPAPPMKKRTPPAPTPAPAKPTPPPPQKKPPAPTKPTPTAAPAKPAPAKTPTPAPTMSYDEWVKKYGPPKPTTSKKPAPTTGGSSGRVKGPPRVDTDFSGVVRESVVGGSRYGSLTGTEMTALGVYIAEVRGALEDVWPQPTGLPGDLSCNVEFTVSASGRISNVRIARSSGNREFDSSVLEAFGAVGSVGPTPDGKPLELKLTFKKNDL